MSPMAKKDAGMQTQWNAEQQAIKTTFAGLGEQVAGRAINLRASGGLDRTSWEAVSSRGLWQLPVATEFGGLGRSWWEFAAGLEGLSSTARDLGFLLSAIAHAGAIRVISEFGTRDQKARFLPRLVRGEVASTATTESQGGSDVARTRTSAEAVGNTLYLSGQKSHITNAPVAGIFVVLGRIPSLGDKRDITLFLLDRSDPGLMTLPAETMLGNATSPTGDLVLDSVSIEERHILGPAGDGLSILYSMLCLDRLLYGLVASAYAVPLLEEALAFAGSRQSFNRPLSEHQYVQDKIVQIKTNMEVARFISYAALERMLDGHADASLLCSIAKLVGTEGLWQSAQEFMQLHGHEGYVEGPVAWVLKDVVATRIAGGTNEMQKVNIFKQLQKLQLEETLK